MSKGSKRRPMSISEQVFKDNWEVIFGTKKCPVKNCHDGMILHFDGDGGVLSEEECEVCKRAISNNG
jgi:hypothetical protein